MEEIRSQAPAKEVLTSKEAAAYMGISMSQLYKLTMERQIPYFKPAGKLIYFERADIIGWLKSNRCPTDAEIAADAEAYRKGAGI